MKAGRELDAIVAQKVMGWTRPKWPVTITPGDCMIPPKGADTSKLKNTLHEDFEGGREAIYWTPPYSTEISAAWEVVEKFPAMQLFKYANGLGWDCYWHAESGPLNVHAQAETAPLAICLAALKALGVEVGNEQTPT